MREEADAKKQGVVTESNDNAEQKVSGTGVTEGVSKDGKLVQDANVQNLNVQQTNVLSDNAQNSNAQNLNVQSNNAQNSNAQTETVPANVKQESSANEPVLTNAERNEAVKENGQVVNADATQNAVEQPGVGLVQPKGDDVGEEKKRKETINLNPDLQTPAHSKSDAISQIESSHDKVMDKETAEAEAQLPVVAKRKEGQPTILEPKPGSEIYKPKTGLPSPLTLTAPKAVNTAVEVSPIDRTIDEFQQKSLQDDNNMLAELTGVEEKAQSEEEQLNDQAENSVVKQEADGTDQQLSAESGFTDEFVSDTSEENTPLPSVDQSILEGMKGQIIAAGETEKVKMHEQNAAKRAAFAEELAKSRENYEIEMQAIYLGISNHFSGQRNLISIEASKYRNQIEQHYQKQQQALQKSTHEKRISLTSGANERKVDFLNYVKEQKQEPYNIAKNEGNRVDTELDQAAASSVTVGNQVASKYPGNDETRIEQRKAAKEVAGGAREEILEQKQPMKEDLLARAEEFDGGFDLYTDDTLLQIENTRIQVDPELDKISGESQKALTAQYKAAIDAVNKKEKAAIAVLKIQEKTAIQNYKKIETSLLKDSVQAEQELMVSLDQQDAQTELEIDQLVEHSNSQLVSEPGVEESAYQTLVADAIAEIQNTSGLSITETAETTNEVINKLAEGFTASSTKTKEESTKVNEKASTLAKNTKAGFVKVSDDFKVESQKIVDKLPTILDSLIKGAFTEVDKAIKDRKGKLKATNDKFRDELKAETDENLLAAKAPLTDDLKDRATEAAEEAGKSWWEAVLDAIGSIIVGLLIVIAAAIVLVALGLCSTILGAMLLIGLAMMAYTFLTSLVARLQMGQGWSSLGWALTDAFGVTGLIEAKTGRDSWTDEKLSDYQRTKRGTESGITILMMLLGARASRGGPKRSPFSVRNNRVKLKISRTTRKVTKKISEYNQKLENFGEFNRQHWSGNGMPRIGAQKTYQNISDGFRYMEKNATSVFRGIDKGVNTLVIKPIAKTVAGINKAPQAFKSVLRTPKPRPNPESKPQSQPHAEFEDGYLYDRPNNELEKEIFRDDSYPYSNEGKTAERKKSYIDSNGDLSPADVNGNISIRDHIRGSEPNKSKSPYTSFRGDANTVKSYGDKRIIIDLASLRRDIYSGEVTNIEIITHEQVVRELQLRLADAENKYLKNPSMANRKSFDNAKRDLDNSRRDKEILIKGIIPKKYFTVKDNSI
jgi:hypothetical protein